MLRVRELFFYIFSFIPLLILGQEKYELLNIASGLPRISHFQKSDFNADSQFWDMARGQDGVYYFGNNDGVIIYDGEHWEKVSLPNNSSVRSIISTNTGTIYLGGYNELGTLEKNENGNYQYVSLISSLGLSNRNFENLWQAHAINETVIYRSFNSLIVIRNGAATLVNATDSFLSSNLVNSIYYTQDGIQGIKAFDPYTYDLEHVFDAAAFNNEEIITFLPSTQIGEIVLVAKSGNIYKGNINNGNVRLWIQLFETEQKDYLNTAILMNDIYQFGTLNSKVLSVSYQGKILPNPPAFKKIQDNTVLNLYKDGKNLWVLLNNGLDFIRYDTHVNQLFEDAAVFDVLIKNDKMYLATNKGFYVSSLKTNENNKHSGLIFNKIDAPQGPAWSLSVVDDHIIGGHNKGLFILNGATINKVGKEEGFWKILSIPNVQNRYLGCSYNGLYVVEKQGSNFVIRNKIKGFDESTRDILPSGEPNTFWVCHGYKGIYKIKLTDDYQRVIAIDQFTEQNGIKSPYNINVYKYNSDIVFTTNDGIYTYDERQNMFEPFEGLNDILDKEINTRKIVQQGDTVWVVQDDQIGYFKPSLINPEVITDPFLNVKGNLNRGLETILPFDANKVLVGTKDGLYLYNLDQQSLAPASTVISKVSISDNLLNQQTILALSGYPLELPTKTDILRFEFSAPLLDPASQKQYRYSLSPVNSNWSPWVSKPYKEYTHLRPDNYKFKVESRNLSGGMGKLTEYEFKITPEWYQTTLAYVMYLLVFLIMLAIGYKLLDRKIAYENRKAQLVADESKRLLKLEIQQLKLKQDKKTLEEDVIYKSKELANYTMQLVNKKYIFQEIQEDLKELKQLVSNRSSKQKLLSIFKKLNQHRIGEDYMNIFNANFERVHHGFFEKLLKIDPKLTKRELMLCAFIKMDLSNKDISPLLSISVRGVETARYRARKKLGITHESNFHEFLVNL